MVRKSGGASATLLWLCQWCQWSADVVVVEAFAPSRFALQLQPTATTTTAAILQPPPPLFATQPPIAEQDAPSSRQIPEDVAAAAQGALNRMQQLRSESIQYAESFGLESNSEAAFFALFRAIRDQDLVRRQIPFLLRKEQVEAVWGGPVEWKGFFSMRHLERAVEDDFLDAARGSTDNRKGWKITDVSVPRGESFEEARMTYQDVQSALEKGTVIFNAAGAHIPRLAGPTLACTDATYLPCALNMYITAAGKRTSAPPHTDKQDVVVIQCTGAKYWRVYSPPNPADKPNADKFARGKMEDSMPLYSMETDLGCKLLFEATLYPGDVMFIPAAFPHTTSTVPQATNAEKPHPATKDTSLHLTMGFDHHIWELDYLSVRRLAYRRAGIVDTALGRIKEDENPYTGPANELPADIHNALYRELPLGFLNDDDDEGEADCVDQKIDRVAKEVERISRAIDESSAARIPSHIWRETAARVRQQGVQLLEIHRDMYLAALEEGRARDAEEAMTAHLGGEQRRRRKVMTPERVQRLSLFRVKRFFDLIDQSKKDLKEWSFAGSLTAAPGAAPEAAATDAAPISKATELAADWPFTAMPVKVGDQVEADLGGAFFPASVTRASGGTYDVQFFDGDRETNLSRSKFKLMVPPPKQPQEEDTSHVTPKQLKRWRKQQEQLKKSMAK